MLIMIYYCLFSSVLVSYILSGVYLCFKMRSNLHNRLCIIALNDKTVSESVYDRESQHINETVWITIQLQYMCYFIYPVVKTEMDRALLYV